jgi:hypothetical protein
MVLQKATVRALLTIAVASLVITLSSTSDAARVVPGRGSTSTQLGVYADRACRTVLSSISWGTLSPGGKTTITLFVKNMGRTAVTLALTTSNWSPSSAPTYFTLTWNRQNYRLAGGAVIDAALTLAVSSKVKGIGSFNFDVTITGKS